MSAGTMRMLEVAMDNPTQLEIVPFGYEKQKELIEKWCPREDAKSLKDLIRKNETLKGMCSNPYMLSVICSKPGEKLNEIIGTLIIEIIAIRETLAQEENLHGFFSDENIVSIIREIAIELVREGANHFASETLTGYIDKWAGDDQTKKELVDKIMTFFVTNVGLIVPADGEDHAYQFIFETVLYYLAASYLYDKYSLSPAECIKELNEINDIKIYCKVVIWLITKAGKKNKPLAEALFVNLSLRGGKESKDIKEILIDLISEKYGLNITGILKNDPDDYLTLNSKRVALARLSLCDLKENEKNLIKESIAYNTCDDFLEL